MKMIVKKIISAILALVLVCTAFSSFVFAADEKSYTLSIPANSGKVEVKVNGEVKHSGGESCFISVPVGADVTVTATAKTGEFMYWTDGNRNTCSEEATFSFKMLGPKELRAWFGATEGTRIIYRNDNTTNQVLGGATCANPEHFNNHLVESASKLGYVFKEWSLSVEQIKEKITNGDELVVVTPVYTKAALTAKISVVNGVVGDGETSVEVEAMTTITLKPKYLNFGKKFVGWKNSAGIFVSESQIFKTTAVTDETYTAVYVNSSSTVTATPGISLDITEDADGALRLWSTHFVPKSYSVISYGFIYIKNGSVDEEYMTLELAEEKNLSVAEYVRSEKSGLLTCTAEADSICARAFMIYTDAEGNMQVAYSSAVTK